MVVANRKGQERRASKEKYQRLKTRVILREREGSMTSSSTDQGLELVRGGDEIGLAVDLDQHAQA
jgi:hypothetical protein